MSQPSSLSSIPNRPLHIGHAIREHMKRRHVSVTWLSRKIHCNRRNIYNIYERESIDSELLMMISIALGYDFFRLFSESLNVSATNALIGCE